MVIICGLAVQFALIALFYGFKTTQQSSKIEPPTSPTQPIIRPSNLEVIKALFVLVNVQNEYYLDKGKFLEKLSGLIALPSHYFEGTVINDSW
ncbi:MAG UNVERIFIED_CONTAM: hypothetical protein LVR29_14015 [Microcystis novacekii LVE1205-3]|jgi:hypothetical protein